MFAKLVRWMARHKGPVVLAGGPLEKSFWHTEDGWTFTLLWEPRDLWVGFFVEPDSYQRAVNSFDVQDHTVLKVYAAFVSLVLVATYRHTAARG